MVGLVDGLEAGGVDVRVDLRGGDVGVAEGELGAGLKTGLKTFLLPVGWESPLWPWRLRVRGKRSHAKTRKPQEG